MQVRPSETYDSSSDEPNGRGAPEDRGKQIVTARLKRIVAYLISFSLAGFLLYLALRGVALAELETALKNASYGWVIPFVIVVLISHALRARRWQILLDALPDRQRAHDLKSVSFKSAFISTLIGYFVNLLAPRFGEFVRAGNLARQEGLRFSGVFGTVVVERIVDIVVLGLGVLSLSFLYYEQFLFLQERIIAPAIPANANRSFVWPLVGLTSIGMFCYFAYRTLSASQSAGLLQLRRRFISILKSFREGIYTMLRAPRRIELIVDTAAMWFCYTIMAYIPVMMLDMNHQYGIGMADAWSLMIFGAIGVAIPSPGGTGSFHYITKIALVSLFAVDETTALTYAVLAHGIHLILYILAGGIALFIQGTSLKSLRFTAINPE